MRKGFTLIEVLFVLGLIAILLSIILPSFHGIQEESLLAKAKTELSILQMAIESYFQKNKTYPPETNYQEVLFSTGLFNQELKDPFLQNNLYDYITYTHNGKTYYILTSVGADRQKNWVKEDIDFGQGTLTISPEYDDIIITNLKLIKQ